MILVRVQTARQCHARPRRGKGQATSRKGEVYEAALLYNHQLSRELTPSFGNYIDPS